MTAVYLGALDQGTTSTRFIVFDRTGRIVSVAQEEHEQIYPSLHFKQWNPNIDLGQAPDIAGDQVEDRKSVV